MRWAPALLFLGCSLLPQRPCPGPEETMARLRKSSMYVEDFEAEAEVSKGAGWLRAHIWASRPGKLKVEISDPLRIHIFHILVRDGRVHLRTEGGNLSLKVPQLPVDVVALACGLPDVEGELVSFRSLRRGCEVTVKGKGVLRKLSLGRGGKVLREEYRTEEGKLLGRRELDDYIKVGRTYLPRRMSFLWDGRKVEVRFLWQRINQGLPGDMFGGGW